MKWTYRSGAERLSAGTLLISRQRCVNLTPQLPPLFPGKPSPLGEGASYYSPMGLTETGLYTGSIYLNC